MGSSLKPLLYGYLRVRLATDDPDAAESGRLLLRDYADLEGFALVDVFVDADECNPQAALDALILNIRRSTIDHRGIAVAVPDPWHLGSGFVAQRRIRDRILREAQVRVIVARVW